MANVSTLYVTIGDHIKVIGNPMTAAVGTDVFQARLSPCGYHIYCVINGLRWWKIANGHQFRNQANDMPSELSPKKYFLRVYPLNQKDTLVNA